MDVVIKRTPSESFGPELWTWRDLITVVTDWAGARGSAVNNRLIRTATLNAYRELGNYNPPWRFLTTLYDIATDAAVELTGYFDFTGGTSEREFVVTSGTIPTWAEFGTLLLASGAYEVDKKVDSTHLTLTLRTNPGEDVGSSGSTVTATLYRSIYPAPADFVRPADPQDETGAAAISYCTPEEFFAEERRWRTSGQATIWTVTAHPKLYGTQAIRLFPYATTKDVIQIPYRRQLRRLTISGYETDDFTGTASGSSASTTLAVSGATPSDRWVGAIVRLRASGTDTPGNVDDQYPYHNQFAVVARSSNNLTLDRALPQAYSGVGFVVSDPLDLPQYALNALQAGAKYHLAIQSPKDSRDIGTWRQIYMDELTRAMEADKSYIPTSLGLCVPWSELDDPNYVYPSP